MTGYGRGEVTDERMTVSAEIRTVNSRFLEFSMRLPRTVTLRENDIKELIRSKFIRGKVNITVTVEHENTNEIPLKINASAAKAYRALLEALKKEVNIQGEISLDHLLKFPEVLEIDEFDAGDEKEWSAVRRALEQAAGETAAMREREGSELMKDLRVRVRMIETVLGEIEQLAKLRIPEERQRLADKLKDLLADERVIDQGRLEFELALFADKLDITEECVRFRSHNKYFLEALDNAVSAGRKLNFLVQEMNREANTIGSKANDATIAHKVVSIKEELEKIREQLQNIE
ncbi:MAG TPA: YicC/YloC family endoribonuclease [Bacteroidota bacterium]|nr:YicC/YloC family endoribonuclease [Bacteroidota bacterium]